VFTHTSWAPDRASSYERLEFLGDSVLELAVARELYESYPDFTEGQLAKIRSHVVSRASCAVVARELGLDPVEVRALADRVLYLERGILRGESGPDEIEARLGLLEDEPRV